MTMVKHKYQQGTANNQSWRGLYPQNPPKIEPSSQEHEKQQKRILQSRYMSKASNSKPKMDHAREYQNPELVSIKGDGNLENLNNKI